MRLAKLTALEHAELKARLKALKEKITGLREILESEERQLDVILEELREVAERFGDPRRTVLLEEGEEEEASVESSMADEDVVVTMSHEGFVKRIPMHLYRRRVTGGKALAGMDRYDEDYLERVFVARTKGWILAFTRGGHAHFLPVLDVPEGSRASRGQSIYALMGASRGDPIVSVVPVDDLEEDRVLIFLTRGGLMKRVKLQEFSNPRAGGIIASGVKKGDEIFDVVLSDGKAEVLVFSREGRAIRFPEDQISVLGRTAQGMKGMGLRGEDAVVGMLLVRRDAQVLTVTETGIGRRTPVDEFPLQNRGGLGNLALPAGEEAGALISALEVVGEEEVMVVSAGGKVVRVKAREVPVQHRRSKGKRIVGLAAGDKVVEVTRASGGKGTTKNGGPEPGGDGSGATTREQMELLG